MLVGYTLREILIMIKTDWNNVASIFDTQSQEAIDPRAADNILIAWPAIITMLQDPSLEYYRPLRLILDFGCGTGSFAHELTKIGYQASGVDPAENMVSIAKRRFRNVVINHGTVNDIPWNYTFDAITSIMVFQFLDEPVLRNTFCRLLSHLEPHARLVFAVHNPDYLHYAKTKTEKYFEDINGQMHIRFKEHGDIKLYPRSSEEYTKILESFGMKKHAESTPPFTQTYIEKYGAKANEPLDAPKFLIMSFVKR